MVTKQKLIDIHFSCKPNNLEEEMALAAAATNEYLGELFRAQALCNFTKYSF